MFKSYSSKSSALKGAKRNQLSNEVVVQENGVWGFHLPDDTTAPADNETVTQTDGLVVHSEGAAPDLLVTHPHLEEMTGETVPVATGRKIEKNRAEQHGVKRPSEGGMCRAVWDYCDALHTAEYVPTAKDVKAQAEAAGWNPNNASIEYYQWRKFNGIRGRLAKIDVTQVSPEPEDA